MYEPLYLLSDEEMDEEMGFIQSLTVQRRQC